MERIVDKARINEFALWPALKAALAERVESITHAQGQVVVALSDAATAEDAQTAAQIVEAHDPDEPTAEERAAADLRDTVRTLAQGAVGTAINDLSAAQQRALVAVLLWRAGALDGELKVRPLGQWANGG